MTPDHEMRGTVSRSVIYVARAGAESLYMVRVVPLVNAVAGSANAGLGAERWADGRTRRKAGARLRPWSGPAAAGGFNFC